MLHRHYRTALILVGLGIWLVAWLPGQSREALSSFESGNFRRAARLLEQEVAEGGASGRAFLLLGVAYLNLGHPDEAWPHLIEASRSLPNEPGTWFNLGLCEFRLGRFEDAITSLQNSLALKPDQPLAHKLIGRIHVAAESPSSAERAFIEAFRLDPADSEAAYLLGRLYQSIGRLEEAARAFEKALEVGGESARTQAYLGTVYFGLGRSREAAEMLEASIETGREAKPPDFVPHLEYGIFLQRMDRLEQSVVQLERAAELGPSELEVWLELGRSLYRLRRLDEARGALNRAVGVDQKDPRPHYLLARICYEQGETSCGDEHAKQAEWSHDGTTQ